MKSAGPPGYASSTPLSPPAAFQQPQQSKPNYSSTPTASSALGLKPATTGAAAPASKGTGGFDELWSSSLSGFGGASASASKPAAGDGQKKSMLDLEREKAQGSLWGNNGNAGQQQQQQKPASSGGFDDFLL